MSKWTNATLTADGQNLQAQLLDGGGFEFTKVTAADSSGTDKLTLTMQPSVIDGKTIIVPVMLSNSNLSAGFTMNQLKFYARKTGIPAGDEIVYAIAEDETGDEIPSESDSPGFTIDWSYTFQFGNATSVNVSIDPAGLVSMALLGNPGGIATLNNAGAVPIEQGGTGAVTASAALAALGGMRASATGDDIPTSASDPTSISSQLSNKANGFVREIAAGENLDDFVTFGSYYVTLQSAPNVTNMPQNVPIHLYVLRADKMESFRRVLQIAVASNKDNPAIWTRRHSDMGWGSWKTIVTAVSPQEYDLPMVEGVTAYGKNTYWKTQEGICFVNLAAHSESASIINEYTISTLPYGYRPNKSVYFAGHGFSEDGNRITLDMQINQSGNIIIWTQSPLKYCSCFVGFIATS